MTDSDEFIIEIKVSTYYTNKRLMAKSQITELLFKSAQTKKFRDKIILYEVYKAIADFESARAKLKGDYE